MIMNMKTAAEIELVSLGKITPHQDGAIHNRLIFRFNNNRKCDVSRLDDLSVIAHFELGGELVPHANSVCFGSEYYEDGDEFPLLYLNVYNNYAAQPDKLEGVTCVYRITRAGGSFRGDQVGLIRIGFVNDTALWRSPSGKDVRPYGNFVIDRERGKLCVFVMRDDAQKTRHYIFELPKLSDGVEENGLRVVTLTPDMIEKQFDTPYMRYMQGAAVRNGLLCSAEGFTNSSTNAPALRFIDCEAGRELAYVSLLERGITVEPELVEFAEDRLYYSDGHGSFYEVLL